MAVEFDPVKDAANVAKHGMSLAKAEDLESAVVVEDGRFAGERRLRAYGLIDGERCCLAFTLRNGRIRAISLRRTHRKEYDRHVR